MPIYFRGALVRCHKAARATNRTACFALASAFPVNFESYEGATFKIDGTHSNPTLHLLMLEV